MKLLEKISASAQPRRAERSVILTANSLFGTVATFLHLAEPRRQTVGLPGHLAERCGQTVGLLDGLAESIRQLAELLWQTAFPAKITPFHLR